jgi:hypothetical protein
MVGTGFAGSASTVSAAAWWCGVVAESNVNCFPLLTSTDSRACCRNDSFTPAYASRASSRRCPVYSRGEVHCERPGHGLRLRSYLAVLNEVVRRGEVPFESEDWNLSHLSASDRITHAPIWQSSGVSAGPCWSTG